MRGARQQLARRLERSHLYHFGGRGRQLAEDPRHARADGHLLWEQAAGPSGGKEWLYRKNTYASSTPVTHGRRVIAFFASSGLMCVDFDGYPQWHVDLGEFPTMHGAGTSPLLDRNEVICIQYQSKGKTLFAAFDKRTGKKLWQHDRPNAMCWSTPACSASAIATTWSTTAPTT